MDLKQLVMLAFQTSIVCTVLGFGLKAAPSDMLYLIRRPWLLARSLVAIVVIMPIVAIVLSRAFDFRPTVEIALTALAISPLPPLLPKKELKAGGHQPYGLGLMAILAALSIVLVPLMVELLAAIFGRSLSTTAGAVASVTLKTALLPLAAGMAVRAMAPRIAGKIEKPVSLVAKVLLPLAALALLIRTAPALWALIGDGTIVAMLLFLTAGLIVGHWLARPDPEHRVVLALSTACRHPAIALSIAAANFPDEHFGGTILLYLIASALASGLYLAWLRRRHIGLHRERHAD